MREEGRGLYSRRRQTHQPSNRNVSIARLCDQCGQNGNIAAALLRFGPDIDLKETRHALASLVHRPGERFDQTGAIESMDIIEQRHSILGLVRLQLANRVKLDIGMLFFERRPLF